MFASLLKSWPGLAEREVRRITKTDCTEWARRFRKVASSTRYNNTIAGLRHVFDVAIEAGIIYGNPAAKLERVPVRPKQLTLPSRAEFLQLVEAVERAGAWCSRDCADFLRGLAFTGCRKGEAAEMRWRDLDFAAGEIVVRGDPETGTKNWTVRRVPMIPDARALFERMRDERAERTAGRKGFSSERGAEGNRQRGTQARHSAHHAPRSAASVRDGWHRDRGRYSDRLPLARAQRRRRTGNENLRTSAPGAQRCTSAKDEFRAYFCPKGERYRIFGRIVNS